MSDNRKDIPASTASNWAGRVTEEVRRYLGRIGGFRDWGVTLGMLVDAGILKVVTGANGGIVSISPGTGVYTGGSGGSSGGGGTVDPYEPDLTPPPMAIGFEVDSGLTNIFVSCDAQLYTQGHGHDRTNVYGLPVAAGAPAPTFSDAVLLYSFQGTVSSYAVNPGTTYHLWIKWQTKDGIESNDPAGGANGLTVTTAQDPGFLLDLLTGRISESFLDQTLRSRLASIDEVSQTLLRTALTEWENTQFQTGQLAVARQELYTRMVEGQSSEATARLALAASLRNADQQLQASVVQEIQARTTAVEAVATLVTQLRSEVFDPFTGLGSKASITQMATAVSSAVGASASTLTQLIATAQSAADDAQDAADAAMNVAANKASLTQVNQAIASASEAITSSLEAQISTVRDDAGRDLTAAIQTEASTRATVDGYLGAQYTVRLDVAGLISGVGLSGTSAPGASPTSTFGVRANTFYVAPPAYASAVDPATLSIAMYDGYVWLDTSVSPHVTRYRQGSAWSLTPTRFPFVIQTTPETINGVTVEPGIYADNAIFARFVAKRGQIGSLAVDDAAIADLSAVKLTAGSIKVGVTISSTGYVSGSAGWAIKGDGTAEFSGVIVRGTVYASAGAIGGVVIDLDGIRSSNYNAAGTGFRLRSNGALDLPDGSVRASTIGVTTLAAIAGDMGHLTAGEIEMIGANGALAVIRSAGKQFADGQSGYFFGRNSADGNLYAEIRCNRGDGRYSRLVMNGNDGYFELSGPWGYITNDGLTVSQANVINTLNIAGNAVLIPMGFSLASGQSFGFNVPDGGYPVMIQGTCYGGVSAGGGDGNDNLAPTTTSISVNGSGGFDLTGVRRLSGFIFTNLPGGINSVTVTGQTSASIVIFILKR